MNNISIGEIWSSFIIHLSVHTSPYRTMQHPNILTVLGAVVSQTSLTVLTNLVRGCNLHTLIFDPGYVRVCKEFLLQIIKN